MTPWLAVALILTVGIVIAERHRTRHHPTPGACPKCGGLGWQHRRSYGPPTTEPCTRCGGSGKVPADG